MKEAFYNIYNDIIDSLDLKQNKINHFTGHHYLSLLSLMFIFSNLKVNQLQGPLNDLIRDYIRTNCNELLLINNSINDNLK